MLIVSKQHAGIDTLSSTVGINYMYWYCTISYIRTSTRAYQPQVPKLRSTRTALAVTKDGRRRHSMLHAPLLLVPYRIVVSITTTPLLYLLVSSPLLLL
jgi:hypothetical protein